MQRSKQNVEVKLQRLFFGLWPESSLQRQLHAMTQDVLTPAARGRPTAPENLHMTLVFLGSVDVVACSCLQHAADAIKLPAFDLALDHLEYSRRRGMLWIAPAQAPGALFDLVSALRLAQSACGLAPEVRDFRPHITLVRHLRHYVTTARIMPAVWRVRQFVLLRSVGMYGAVRYEKLRTWSLG